MFNENKFRAILLLQDKTLQDVANLLDITLPTLYRKMRGKSDFKRMEMQKIRDYLKLRNPDDIFYAE